MNDVDSYPVSKLVQIRLDKAQDKWRLSVVQRSPVWDAMRAAYLLDSLLFGYPIGSLLLCSVEEDGHVLVQEGDSRVEQEAPPDMWQLLDGQQRLNALAWLFAGEHDGAGKFFLHMTAVRKCPEVTKRQKARKEELSYIRLGAGMAPDGEESLPGHREEWLDLSGWSAFASRETLPVPDAKSPLTPEKALGLLTQIDPKCKIPLDGGARTTEAARRTQKLLEAWNRDVPVQKVRLESPSVVSPK